MNSTHYRVSLYTIFINLDDSNGDFLLIHGYTGAIDRVSNSVAWFLRTGQTFEEKDIAQLPFSAETFQVLVKRGYLTNKTPFEEREQVKLMAEIFHKQEKKTRSFLFLVAYDCNFRCPYCFENTISSNGKGWSKKVFTKHAVDRAYEAMLELEPERAQHHNGITLYGGEPLLAQNRDVVKYIVEEGKKRDYMFSAITNGYDLKHFQDLLNPEAITNLQITLDGKKEHHDKRRTHFKDGNSYDKIIENIDFVLKQGVKVSVRINTDLNNFDDIQKLNTEFKNLGFFNYNFSAYSALVHGGDEMNCNTVMGGANFPEKKGKKADFQAPDAGHFDPDQQYINFEAEQNRFLNQASNTTDNPEILAFHDDDFSHQDKILTMNRGKYIQKYQDAVQKNPELGAISCQDFGVTGKLKRCTSRKRIDEFPFYLLFCSNRYDDF